MPNEDILNRIHYALFSCLQLNIDIIFAQLYVQWVLSKYCFPAFQIVLSAELHLEIGFVRGEVWHLFWFCGSRHKLWFTNSKQNLDTLKMFFTTKNPLWLSLTGGKSPWSQNKITAPAVKLCLCVRACASNVYFLWTMAMLKCTIGCKAPRGFCANPKGSNIINRRGICICKRLSCICHIQIHESILKYWGHVLGVKMWKGLCSLPLPARLQTLVYARILIKWINHGGPKNYRWLQSNPPRFHLRMCI